MTNKILNLKGNELDEWLERERSLEIEILEEFYKREEEIENTIRKIRNNPRRQNILIKEDNRIIIEGDIKPEILKYIIKEGYELKE